MRIKFKRRPRGVVALTIVLAMLLTLVTACNIDYSALSEGLNDLGNAMDMSYNQTPATPDSEETISSVTDTSETKETEETTSESSSETTSETSESSSETSETDPSETSETSESSSETSESSSETSETTTGEPDAAATPTPTPTPHPTNERVDFSYLRTADLSENFAVNTEDFSENVGTEDDKPLAVFSGKRMVVSKAGSENVSEAINLILDSFYQEAAGLYSRYAGEAKAAYGLSGVVDTVYNVEVNFDYSYNKRILSVIMSYKVTAGKSVLASSEEYASFDMLTGQYVTLAAVADDWVGLQNALRIKLAKNVTISNASAITDLYVTAQQPGAQTATVEIYGTYGGKRYHTTGDMNEYAKFLNRYGKIIYSINEDTENAQ